MYLYLGISFSAGMGAVLRYCISRLFLQAGVNMFPFATLLVNVVGSFLIGFLVIFLQHKLSLSESNKVILITGFLGGFTTFSAFSLETIHMLEQGEHIKAMLYVSVSIIFCLFACGIGFGLAKNLP